MPEENDRANAMLYAYGEDGPDAAISSACLDEIGAVSRSSAGMRSSTPHVRDGMTRGDYEFYRPSEGTPRHHKAIIALCDEFYWRIGIVHYIIDLMSDFAAQGIEIFHPNKTKQSRYRHWFRKVDGKERSERFLNYLYRHGNVIIRRAYADLNAGDLEDLERGIAGRTPSPSEDIEYERGPKIFRNRIPIQYSFLNPTAVEVIGGDLAMFAGRPHYGLKLPESLLRSIKNPKTDEERRLVGLLPDYILGPIRGNKKVVPLDPEKIEVYHYKKDDWQHWAHPMTYSVISDLRLYEKMKLADTSALDGAVSHIRLWTLGLPELKIQPGPKAFQLLREQLQMAGNGGTLDLMWDASLKLSETKSDTHQFLGITKYQPTLQAIYAAFGIPQTLTSGVGQGGGGGSAGSALSLKTLIERLQYGRDLVKKFWENELNILQEAFGDRSPAQVHFENMSLSDEANEKMLWVQLVDRDIISIETLREKFGTIPAVEEARLRREYDERGDDEMPEKLGPFNEPSPNAEATATKAMQVGLVATSQTKAKTGAKKPGDKSLMDHQKEMQGDQLDLQKQQMESDRKLAEREQKVREKQGEDIHSQKLEQNDEVHQQRLRQKDDEHKATLPIKKQALKKRLSQTTRSKGQPGQGRPRNSVDQKKRKKRVDVPRTGAAVPFMERLSWAKSAQRTIAEVLTPIYVKRCNKKNMRGLSTAQAEEFEGIKSRIFFNLGGDSSGLDADGLVAMMLDPPASSGEAEEMMAGWASTLPSPPTIDEVRDMQATVYAILNTRGEGGGDGEVDADA